MTTAEKQSHLALMARDLRAAGYLVQNLGDRISVRRPIRVPASPESVRESLLAADYDECMFDVARGELGAVLVWAVCG